MNYFLALKADFTPPQLLRFKHHPVSQGEEGFGGESIFREARQAYTDSEAAPRNFFQAFKFFFLDNRLDSMGKMNSVFF